MIGALGVSYNSGFDMKYGFWILTVANKIFESHDCCILMKNFCVVKFLTSSARALMK